MGIFYSSYQCLDVGEQCTHKGPFDTSKPTSDPTNLLKRQQPQEYLDAIAGKTSEEIKTLMEYTGSLLGMTPEQKGQAMCNVLGGGLYQMCCDPTKTSITDMSPGYPIQFKRNAFGQIESIVPCQCPFGDQECIAQECSGPDYKTQLTEYEFCKTFPKNGSDQNIRQLSSRDILPDCITKRCTQDIIPKKIALYDHDHTLFASTRNLPNLSSGHLRDTPKGQQTIYPSTTFAPPRTAEDDYARVIKLAIFILLFIWLLFYLGGAKSAKPSQKYIRTKAWRHGSVFL